MGKQGFFLTKGFRNFPAVKLEGCNISVCSYLKEFAQIAAMKHLTTSRSRNNEI